MSDQWSEAYGQGDFLRLVCFNVGHGACILVSLPPGGTKKRRRYGVIDCNETHADSVDEYLRNPPPEAVAEDGDTSDKCELEFVAVTHYDTDHFRGIVSLLGSNASRFFARPCRGSAS